jgi:probable phosphoglycerate mutase
MSEQRWPDSVWLARHGESAGNVARDRAEAEHLDVIDIGVRDMDVGLSARGEEQAAALGRRLADTPADERPAVVLCSPYVRAEQTARIALRTAGIGVIDVLTDDRLREREFGMLDRLTRAGIGARYPEQAQARAFLGKFYHRPPGGESWCDVALRLRSVLDTLSRDHSGERVMLVTHQVVILMFRYLLEHLTEAEILAIDRAAEVANCSLTIFDYDEHAGRRGDLVLTVFNDVSHVRRSDTEVTAEPDAPSGSVAADA